MMPRFPRRPLQCRRGLFVKFRTHPRPPIAVNQRRSPRAIAVYSYIVAGFTLPFAVPAAAGRRSSGHKSSSVSNMSLYHCCR